MVDVHLNWLNLFHFRILHIRIDFMIFLSPSLGGIRMSMSTVITKCSVLDVAAVLDLPLSIIDFGACLNFHNVSLLSVHDRDVYSQIKEIKKKHAVNQNRYKLKKQS